MHEEEAQWSQVATLQLDGARRSRVRERAATRGLRGVAGGGERGRGRRESWHGCRGGGAEAGGCCRWLVASAKQRQDSWRQRHPPAAHLASPPGDGSIAAAATSGTPKSGGGETGRRARRRSLYRHLGLLLCVDLVEMANASWGLPWPCAARPRPRRKAT